jgi:hypothetical protein
MSGQIPGMTTQLPRLAGRSAGAKRSDPDFFIGNRIRTCIFDNVNRQRGGGAA